MCIDIYRRIHIHVCVLDQVTPLLKSTQLFPIILRSKTFTKVYKRALDHLSCCVFYSFLSYCPFFLVSLLLVHTNNIPVLGAFLYVPLMWNVVLPCVVWFSPSLHSCLSFSVAFPDVLSHILLKITPLVTLPPHSALFSFISLITTWKYIIYWFSLFIVHLLYQNASYTMQRLYQALL